MNIRGDFQKTQAAKDFAAMHGTGAFEDATKAALLIVSQNLAPASNDPQLAAANAFRLAGAHQMVDALKSLTVLDTPKKPIGSRNLDHTLK